ESASRATAQTPTTRIHIAAPPPYCHLRKYGIASRKCGSAQQVFARPATVVKLLSRRTQERPNGPHRQPVAILSGCNRAPCSREASRLLRCQTGRFERRGLSLTSERMFV